MTAPITTTPVAAPVAPPMAGVPAAAPVAAPAAPAGLPPGFGAPAPKIGNLPSSASGGIAEDHFHKPILFHILSVSSRPSRYEEGQVQAPTVDYIVLDPATGEIAEVRNITIMQKNIRNELVNAFSRGLKAVTGVAMVVPTSNSNPAKVLRPLDDTNSGYGAEKATELLATAAQNLGWWGPSA